MFFAKLDHMLEVAAKQLDDRFKFQKTAFAKQFPLLMKSLWIGADKLKPYDTIESVIELFLCASRAERLERKVIFISPTPRRTRYR